MTMIHALLKNYRQSPRKVRLLANLVKGKPVTEVLAILNHTPKRASKELVSLVNSAIANAKNNFNLDPKKLVLKDMTVNGGVTLKRSMPRARGMAYRINKRTSHIKVVLSPIDAEVKVNKK